MSYNLLWWQETYKDWWSGGFSAQHAVLTNALSDSIHEVRYNPLVVEDSSGINNISVEAHEKILEDQLRFITNG